MAPLRHNGAAVHDVVYTGATVVTMDERRTIARGIWTRGDTIVAIGDPEDLMREAPSSASIRDLEGATILPGFIDAHCHFALLAYLQSGADCSSRSAPDIPRIQQLLALAAPGPEGWVTGSGYSESTLAEGRHPTRWDLDKAVPDVPCVLYHASLHACVVNSAGLIELGLHRDSPDARNGRYERDLDGRLTGLILEQPALDLWARNMERHFAALDADRRLDLVRAAGAQLSELGITSCADASIDPTTFQVLRQAEDAGALSVRITAMFMNNRAGGIRTVGMGSGFGSAWLKIGAIKYWADGGMSSRTAAVDPAYAHSPDDRGLLIWAAESLGKSVRAWDDAGFQVAIHAQGERAIEVALLALSGVIGREGNTRRHRIEHGGAFRADLQEQAARLGVCVVSQPGFLSVLGDGFHEAFGSERSEYLYPFASLLQMGVVVAGSSDAPVISASPLLGIRDAMVRRTVEGRVIGMGERLDPTQAVELYTRNAAYVLGVEDRVGTLEPGKAADFVVLADNPLRVSPETVADIPILATIVGGNNTYARPLRALMTA
ncbi:MAG: hypothetical protein QOD78_1298 [Chloroflexota bacterium]|nr:hypothetical protein [Chloroflexota bacterium]MEA2612411.1 hypothetical protein [Chloroflexota bacterium]